MKLRAMKRRTQAAMASGVVVTLRVPAGFTAWTAARALQSLTRNRIRAMLPEVTP